MSTWKNEDDIKAELRTLTKELRQIREELRSMVTPPKPNPARTLLHRSTWSETHPSERAEAADTDRKKAPIRQKK